MPRILRILLVGWFLTAVSQGQDEPSAAIARLQPGRYAGFWGWHKISALYEVTDVDGDAGQVSGTVQIQLDSFNKFFSSKPPPFGFVLHKQQADGGWQFEWVDPPWPSTASEPVRITATTQGPLLSARFDVVSEILWEKDFAGFWLDHDRVRENPNTLPSEHLQVSGELPARLTIYTSSRGLAHNACRSALQTSDGMLWVGTVDGLSRFDGSEWQTLRSESSSLPDDNIRALAEDPEGRLLIGTKSSGIWRRDHTGVFRPFWRSDLAGLGHVNELNMEGNGDLWADFDGTIGLKRADGRTRTWTAEEVGFPAPATTEWGDKFGAKVIASPGKLLLSSPRGLGLLHQEGGFTYVPGLIARKNAQVGRLARGHGFFHFAQSSFLLFDEDFLPTRSRLISETSGILKVTKSGDANLWLVTGDGLFYYRAQDDALLAVPAAPTEFCVGLHTLFEDRQGNLWLFHGGDGVVRVEPSFVEFIASKPGDAWQPRSVAQGADGEVFAAGGRQIRRVDPASDEFLPERVDGTEFQGMAIDGEGTMWTAVGPGLGALESRPRQLLRWVDGTLSGEGIPPLDLEVSRWYGVVARSLGEIWLGTAEGVVIYDGMGFQNWNDAAGVARFRVDAILEDARQGVWFGGEESGLYFHEDGQATRRFTAAEHGLASDNVHALYEDSEGRFWVGSSGGLCLFHPEGNRFQVFAEGPLGTNAIHAIVEDGDRRLWLGTPTGLYVVSLEELTAASSNGSSDDAVRRVGRVDGLENENIYAFQFPAACRGKDGLLYFCMEGGVARIDPRFAPLDHYQGPPVRISNVSTFGEEGVAAIPFTESSTLTLPPSAQNLVRLDFGAVCLKRPEALRYEYRLVGSSDDWVPVGSERRAWFDHLRPRDYRFEVRARDYRQTLSPETASLAFTIQPHLHQTWAFRLGMTAVGLAVAWGILGVWQRNRTRVFQLSKQLEMETERTRIARDMHDEIGTDLAKIRMLADLVPTGPHENETAHPKAISSLAQRCSDSLREIIWSLNSEEDHGDDLDEFLRSVAEQALEASAIHFQFSSSKPDKGVASRAVSPARRRQIVLILKGIVSNVLRHSEATEFKLVLTTADAALHLVAEDNGIGFDPDKTPTNTLGLSMIRDRASELGGSMTLKTSIGKGTKIAVEMPFASER